MGCLGSGSVGAQCSLYHVGQAQPTAEPECAGKRPTEVRHSAGCRGRLALPPLPAAMACVTAAMSGYKQGHFPWTTIGSASVGDVPFGPKC